MPYQGVPKSKTAKLDRCVQNVMKGKQFDKTYKNRNNKDMSRKSLAIVICRTTMKI